MLRIAICDDNYQDREKIKTALADIGIRKNIETEVKEFKSGEELFEKFSSHDFDLILLDIFMEELDGIEIAKKLRNIGALTKIVFISSTDTRIREMLGMDIFAFLDKPLIEKELEKILIDIIEINEKENQKVFTYKLNKSQKYVVQNNIVYIRSIGHKIEMITTESRDIIEFSAVLKDIWDILQNNDSFAMPNRSEIVNLKYSEFERGGKIKISHSKMNGLIDVSIGRTNKKETMKRYYQFLRNRE